MNSERDFRLVSRVCVIMLAILGWPAAAAAQCTTVAPCADAPVNLGSLEAGFLSYASGVSADGSVVVGTSDSSDGSRAIRWSGGSRDPLLPSGHLMSYGNDVNYDGSVIVGYSVAGTDNRAFRWVNGVMEDIGVLSGGSYAMAYGVSYDGSVVVGYSNPDSSFSHAFLWKDGTMTDLGVLATGQYSLAFGVSGDGTVVVGVATDGTGQPRAFRWANGTMNDLGTLGGTQSSAMRANYDGSVVVGSAHIAAGSAHAFRWFNNTMEDLGVLSGDTASLANSVSGDGSIVVGASYSVSGSKAFRWTSGSGMQDLNGLLSTAGVDMTGITLTSARGIAANGQYIVGIGDFGSGEEAYVVRYDDGIGGLMTPGAAAASVNALADTRLGMAAQQHGFAAPLLGGNTPMGTGSEAGVFATAGSMAGGGFVRYAAGNGLSLLAGLSYAEEAYPDADLKHAGMGALALQYVHRGTGAWHPFAESGAWHARDAALSFSRAYMNGAGTATGVGDTHGDLSYAYARAGVLVSPVRETQLAVSAEIGRQWLATDAYAEHATVGNPFPAQVSEGTDTTDLAKLRLQWSQRLGARLDSTLWLAGVYGFNRSTDIAATVAGVGTLTPAALGDQAWAEYGARVGYKMTDTVTVDVFANGVSGGDGIGTRVHAGGALRFQF